MEMIRQKRRVMGRRRESWPVEEGGGGGAEPGEDQSEVSGEEQPGGRARLPPEGGGRGADPEVQGGGGHLPEGWR